MMKLTLTISVALIAAWSAATVLARADDTNLARGKPCKFFSSKEADSRGASKLTDGEKGGIGWSSRSFANYSDHRLYPEFVVVDLGLNATIRRVVLHPCGEKGATGRGFPEDFTIQVCREGEPWRVVVEKQGYPDPTTGQPQTFDLPRAEGRYVKVEATLLRAVEENKYRFQLAEIEVYGQEKPLEPLAAGKPTGDARTKIAGLRCEHYVDPVGVDARRPRFDWILESTTRGQRQTAYRVLVATDRRALDADRGDLWDSGKVASDQSVAVRYAGLPLKSGQQCFWKVIAWDKDGNPTAWSEPAVFITGKLGPEDWQGQWIGANIQRETPPRTVLGFAVEARAPDDVKWVQVDLGAAKRIDQVVLHPMYHEDSAAGGWIKGYGFPLRLRLDVSDEADFKTFTTIADHTAADYPNPGLVQVAFDAGGKTARYVRLTVTKLWHRGPGLPHVYTLAEMQVFSGGKNAALGATVTANSSVEGSGWAKAQLTDGKALAPATETPAVEPAEKLKYPHGAVYLRKEVAIDKPVTRATVFFCGLGYSELTIDGRKVGDYVVGPGFTTYNKRTQYLVFDVTDRFSQMGRRTLGVTLADGWYGLDKEPWGHNFHNNPYVDAPKLLLNLHLEHPDGTETVVVSDESWKWSEGEITYSWIAQEDVDRREARAGWNQAGYDDNSWRPVAVVKGPAGRLVHQKEPPCRIVGEVRPVSMKYDRQSNTCIYDFGREINGWVRFRTFGPAGAAITITTIPSAPYPRTSRFVLAGGGDEVYEPRFFYAGMRQVVVRGATRPPKIEDLTGCLVSSGWTSSGSFRCSDGLVNWLNGTVRRTSVAYTTFLPNDPVREWKAWMEDPQNMFWSNAYLFDARALYERWQWDIIDGQRADGNCPNVAPGAFFDAYNSPWWGGCVVWVPWNWYLYYGDATLLEDSYPTMKRYVDYLGTAANNGIQDWGLDDWQPVEKTPRAIINTPAHYLFAAIVSRTAEMMGKREDAERYAEVAKTVRNAFNDRFLDPDTGVYGGTCTQAGQVMPLALGLVPDQRRQAVEESLLNEIAAHRNRLSTGFVSTPYLLQIMADLAPEIGWEMTTAQGYPSWYSMTAGSDNDLMKECWSGGQALMPSLGGNIAAWHYQSLGGIRPDPAGPGFKRFVIKPNVVGDLHWVECWYDSVHGRITSNWRRRDDQFVMEVTVPANTTATVWVPAQERHSVKENGLPAAQAPGVEFLRMEDGRAVFLLGGGVYRFESRLATQATQGSGGTRP